MNKAIIVGSGVPDTIKFQAIPPPPQPRIVKSNASQGGMAEQYGNNTGWK